MARRGLYGATEAEFHTFRGLVEDVDPAELAEDRASAAVNVDFDGHTVRKRLGKAVERDLALASPTRAIRAYYPKDGSARKLLLQAGTTLSADGTAIATGLTGGRPMDLVPFQDRIYAGNGVDGVQRWFGTGSAESAANPTVPSGLAATSERELLQDFNDATDWTASDASLTVADFANPQGTVLALEASGSAANGEYIEAAWSAGGTVDLSGYGSLSLKTLSSLEGLQIQIGVKDNSGTIHWLDDYLSVTAPNAWQQQHVSLINLDLSNFTASPGLAIGWSGVSGIAVYPATIYFHDSYGIAPIDADTYTYYATHVNTARGYESAPAGPATLTLAPLHETAYVQVSVAATVEAGIDEIWVYRHRHDAEFARPRRVAILPNTGTPSFRDDRSDADILLAGEPELLTQFQIDPPLAQTYAVVGNRLWAGNISVPVLGDFERFPWRAYASRYGKPEAFASAQDPTDPLVGGWLDLPTRDGIVRIVEVDGQAVFLAERSIHTVEGTGWDDYNRQQRAAVGLDAREAVAVWGRLIFFLAADGVRALDLRFGENGFFRSWILSEPIAARLRNIPRAYRKNAAMGIDERGRLHLSYPSPGSTVNDAAVVLDLQAPGALDSGPNPQRPGWTAYTGWGFSCFDSLKRGGGDDGELLGGDPAAGKAWRLHRTSGGAELETDAGATVAWSWTGPAGDVGRGKESALVYVGGEFSPAAGEEVTLEAVVDQGEDTHGAELALGAATTGVVKLLRRIGGAARWVQLRVSGSNSVKMVFRSGAVGFWLPKVR